MAIYTGFITPQLTSKHLNNSPPCQRWQSSISGSAAIPVKWRPSNLPVYNRFDSISGEYADVLIPRFKGYLTCFEYPEKRGRVVIGILILT